MHLLHRIERHLKESATPATRFGREAMHDPQFVHDLRRGREARPETIARVVSFIEQRECGR